MSTRARTAGAVLAALANVNFLLAPLVGSRLDPVTTTISELAVAGQPAPWLFRGLDVVTGLLVVALGVALTRGPVRRVPEGLAAVAYGAGTLVAALLPLPCAGSGCRADTLAELAHDLPSGLATAGAVVGTLLLLWRHRRAPARARAGAVVVAVVVLLPLLLATPDPDHAGLAQRVHTLGTSLWLLAALLPSVARSARGGALDGG